MNGALTWATILDGLDDILTEIGGSGWLVGGCLRNALLDVSVADVDAAMTPDPVAVAERLARRLSMAVARLGHGTVRLVPRDSPHMHLDLTRLQGVGIIADLSSRDFTANAMALPLTSRRQWLALVADESSPIDDLVDPFGGREDIMARHLVAVGPLVFGADPGRIIRAARLRALFGLEPDEKTVQAARRAVPLLAALSADRVHEEMALLLALPRGSDGLELLHTLGALTVLYPGLDGETATQALATLRQLDVLMVTDTDAGVASSYPAIQAWGGSVERRVALRLAAIEHARVARDTTSTYQSHWRQALEILELDDPDDRVRAARRYLEYAGRSRDAAMDRLVVAAAWALATDRHRGDILSIRADALIDMYLHERSLLEPPPLITGRELISVLGIPPGPAVGRLLRQIRHAQLAGACSTPAEALEMARRLAETSGND